MIKSILLRGRAVLCEVGLLVAGYAFYAFVRGLVGSADSPADQARATRNAEQIVGLERHLGIFVEPTLEHDLLGSPWLVRALDTFWSYGYLLGTIGVILWLVIRHTDLFRPLRSALFVCTMVAVGVFAMFPTVPPRLLPPSYRTVDTWSVVGGIAARTPPRIEHISDPFASMPSLHVAWAVWCAIAIGMTCRRRWTRIAVWIYPAATIFAVVATGNHYVLDCVAGAALMIGANRIVWALGEVRGAQPVAPVRQPALVLGSMDGSGALGSTDVGDLAGRTSFNGPVPLDPAVAGSAKSE